MICHIHVICNQMVCYIAEYDYITLYSTSVPCNISYNTNTMICNGLPLLVLVLVLVLVRVLVILLLTTTVLVQHCSISHGRHYTISSRGSRV